MAVITGGLGGAQDSRSADPERDVDALLPCLATMRRDEARMEDVVLILNVLWESPPVPTMSHCTWLVVRISRCMMDDRGWPKSIDSFTVCGVALEIVDRIVVCTYQTSAVCSFLPSSLV